MNLLLWEDFKFRYRYVPETYTWYCDKDYIERSRLSIYNSSNYVCYHLAINSTTFWVGASIISYYHNRDGYQTQVSVIVWPISKLILMSRYVSDDIRRLLFKDRVIAAVLVAGAFNEYFKGIVAHMEEFY